MDEQTKAILEEIRAMREEMKEGFERFDKQFDGVHSKIEWAALS
ncbi:hypothetical protein ACE41H_23410 [Paenibacillus enshidis]|uniref:Uncharacterized protein n=1 Tax=Paenibacillus enshidis TaxID=1458439 RepID=A0ABV5B1Z2_9BACL